MKRRINESGYTLIEILISLFITVVLAASGFEFYVSMHNQTLAQEGISEMQQASTACLQEIAKTIRQAGYKIGSHIPYLINGDSLYVFYSETQAVDTILYYLEEYSESELSGVESIPQAQRPKKLMRKINSESPCIFSDNINDITFDAPDAMSIIVALEVQTMKPDEDYADNEGYRLYTSSETIVLRNIRL